MNISNRDQLEKRFLNGILKTESCWLWQKGKTHDGYGRIQIDAKSEMTHRLSYLLYKGPITAACVCHRCDMPACVNPDHLFLGSHKDNQQDSVAKKRHRNSLKTHCVNGHLFSVKNTYYEKSHTKSPFWRRCRKCHADREYAHRLKKIKSGPKLEPKKPFLG
jgi:hypothetical protein